MKFILNGKDYGNGDLDLLIHYDSVTELTELQFYGNDGEHILDSDSCDISIDIAISSEDDIRTVFEDTLDLKSSAFTAEHAANIIKRELNNMQKQYDKTSIHSQNLFQMHTYVTEYDNDHEGIYHALKDFFKI